MRSLETGKPLRRTAEESQGARLRNKLIGKTTWFKQKKTKLEGAANKKSKGARKSIPAVRGSTPSTVIFVEQTPQGELAQRLRDLFQRLEPTLGFTIKTVERTGATLRSKFPLYNVSTNSRFHLIQFPGHYMHFDKLYCSLIKINLKSVYFAMVILEKK